MCNILLLAAKALIYMCICNHCPLDPDDVASCGTSNRYGISGAANPVTGPDISLSKQAAHMPA
jgi:hypothetical protein